VRGKVKVIVNQASRKIHGRLPKVAPKVPAQRERMSQSENEAAESSERIA
jgi:hypothetical protein